MISLIYLNPLKDQNDNNNIDHEVTDYPTYCVIMHYIAVHNAPIFIK